MNSNASNAFRVARDELLALSPAEQRTSFEFPRDLEDFNWAHDWFDVIAKDNDRVALRIAEVGGADNSYTFAELSRRSNQVANWLLDQGVKPGAVLMLMLDNQIELWELMLAALKIGAVILPTSVVLGEHERKAAGAPQATPCRPRHFRPGEAQRDGAEIWSGGTPHKKRKGFLVKFLFFIETGNFDCNLCR